MDGLILPPSPQIVVPRQFHNPMGVCGAPHTSWHFECRSRNNRLRWREHIENLTTYEGLNDWLNKYLKGSSYSAAFYVGLIDSTAAATLGSAPFATTNSSPTITVTHTSHGGAVGDRVYFAGAAAVAGLTLAGEYTIVTVPNANSYTITAGSNANATTTGGGSAVTVVYLQKADTAAKCVASGSLNYPTSNGWGECEAYSESLRQTLTLGSVANQSVDNSGSKAVFSINGSKTVLGGFVASNSAKHSTSGIILGEAIFATPRAVISGDTLNVTVTATAASG